MSKDGNFCVTSIRHPDEINELRKRNDFILINVDAPRQMRFERMRKRNRPGDSETLEKFIELEKRESQNGGSGQQLSKCAEMADVNFINDLNDIDALNIKAERLLSGLSARIKRNV